MLTSRRLIAVLTAAAATTAALVLVSPTGAQAAPKPKPSSPGASSSLSLSAPYTGAATFSGSTPNCDLTTVCELSGSAEAATGRSTISALYQRTQPVTSGGGVYGRARQDVSYSVPQGAKTVTAVLTYQVDSASAAAAPTAGSVYASASLFAWFGDSCVAPACQYTSAQQRVVSTYGPYGLPGPPQHVTEPYTQTLTVTATGTLPPALLLQAHTLAGAGGYGEYGPYCLHWDGCSGPSLEAHGGLAEAKIDATLRSVHFTSS